MLITQNIWSKMLLTIHICLCCTIYIGATVDVYGYKEKTVREYQEEYRLKKFIERLDDDDKEARKEAERRELGISAAKSDSNETTCCIVFVSLLALIPFIYKLNNRVRLEDQITPNLQNELKFNQPDEFFAAILKRYIEVSLQLKQPQNCNFFIYEESLYEIIKIDGQVECNVRRHQQWLPDIFKDYKVVMQGVPVSDSHAKKLIELDIKKNCVSNEVDVLRHL